MIDLRSDTVTKPTDEMRKAISEALVGDDVWGDDPTVKQLQDMICELSGKDAALYVPSGTMSNQIAIAAACNSGDEIICEASAHIIKYEAAAPAVIARVLTKTIKSTNGQLELDEITEAIRPVDLHFPVSRMLCLENTHNALGGRVLPLEYIQKAGELAKDNKMHYHCDGARLWNASIAAGVSMLEYCTPFDSVSLCLSKGLGAPVGSVLAGSEEFIHKAKRLRKMLGGGMRQAGIIASAGVFAINNHFNRLNEDHTNAKTFASILAKSEFIDIDIDTVETNIVYFKYKCKAAPEVILNSLLSKEIAIGAAGKNTFRAVFHLQVSADSSVYAAEEIVNTIEILNRK